MNHEPDFCRFCGNKLDKKVKEGKERFYCLNCDRVLYQDRTPAAAVFIRHKDKFLVVKRGIEPWKNKWSLPAGYMELEESPRETAVRELKEETGIVVEEEKLSALTNFSIDHPDGKKVVVMVYKAENFSGDINTDHEIEEAGFKAVDGLDKAPLLNRILKIRDNE